MGNDSVIAKNLKQAVEMITAKASHVWWRRKTECDMLVSPGERNDPAFHASHRLAVIYLDADGVPAIFVTVLVEYRTKGGVEVTFNFHSEADGPRFVDSIPEEWFDIAPVRCPEWRARILNLTHPVVRARLLRRKALAAKENGNV
jgi:hypothetical protein